MAETVRSSKVPGETTLRTQAVRAFWLFGVTLVGFYAALAIVGFTEVEDRVLRRQLLSEVERLLALEAVGELETGIANPSLPWIQSYLGEQNLPGDLEPPLRQRKPGDYEAGHLPFLWGGEYLYSVRQLPGRPERLFVIFDTDGLELETENQFGLLFLLIGALLTLGLGLFWGRRLAHRVTSPLTRLATALEVAEPKALGSSLRQEDLQGEVGQVARALSDALERVEAFIEREQRFTRDASHELRTPITVMGGVTDLLSRHLPLDDQRGRKFLQRQRRAIQQMEELIEAFLWIAREEGTGHDGPATEPEALLSEVVERHRHLLGDRPVAVELQVTTPSPIYAPPSVIAITVGNLISNAFHNTASGRVRIELEGSRLEISDTGSGIPSDKLSSITEPFTTSRDEPGHGLGLAIVKNISQRFGWELQISSEAGRGTSIRLNFDGGAPRASTSGTDREPR